MKFFSYKTYPMKPTNLVHHIVYIDITKLKSVSRLTNEERTIVRFNGIDDAIYDLTAEQHNLLIAKIKEQAVWYRDECQAGKTPNPAFHIFVDGISNPS